MNFIGQKELFRLALSYHERAVVELRKWEALRTGRKLDRTNFDQVQAKYTVHERDARKLVESLAASADRELAPVENELRQKQRAQRKLIDGVAAGKIDARTANAQNRALSTDVADLSARADDLRDIVSADTTAALGGPIDLPLEEYAGHFEAGVVTRPPRRSMTPLEKNIAAGIVMFALVVGTVVVLAILRSVVNAEFSVSERDVAGGVLVLECKNTGNRALMLYVPWPNGRPHAPAEAPAARRSFGAIISVREAGSTQFRVLEGVEGVFKYRGRLLEDGTAIEVAPGTTSMVFLDLNLLREQGLDPDAISVEFSRNGGGSRTRHDVEIVL